MVLVFFLSVICILFVCTLCVKSRLVPNANRIPIGSVSTQPDCWIAMSNAALPDT
jgi:hypothetical protein